MTVNSATVATDRDTETVSFFVPTLEMGGAERVTVNLANGFARRGASVTLLLARREGDLLDEVDPDLNVEVVGGKRVPGVGIMNAISGIVRHLRRTRPDTLVSSMVHANNVAAIATTVANLDTRLVLIQHNTPSTAVEDSFNPIRNRVVYTLADRVYPLADEIVAVSGGVADDMATEMNLSREDVSVIYNPIVTEETLAESPEAPDHPWYGQEEPPVVLGAGRLTDQKNFQLLVRAFSKVRARRDSRLLIFGRGRNRTRLRELITELDLDGDIQLHQPVDNDVFHQYLAHSGVFVLSSNFEGLPTVLIEALAYGCPIVSTDCPSGPAEILADGEYGRLVPVGDADALADSTVAVLADPPDPERLRERSTTFSLRAAIDRYAEIL